MAAGYWCLTVYIHCIYTYCTLSSSPQLIRVNNRIYRDAVSSLISGTVTKGHTTCHSCHRGTPQGKTVREDWTVTVETLGLVGYCTLRLPTVVPVTNGHLVELTRKETNGLLSTHPLKQGIVASHWQGHPLNLA